MISLITCHIYHIRNMKKKCYDRTSNIINFTGNKNDTKRKKKEKQEASILQLG